MKKLIRRFLLLATVLAAGAVGLLGWQWLAELTCRQVQITGVHHADASVLQDMARVDTGMVLFDLDPHLVADRVQRHPWVREAHVTRLLSGVLHVDVEERTPVVLVVDASGRPTHYLDRDGYAMPLTHNAVYDVPLMRGDVPPYQPLEPLQRADTRALLAALADADADTDALISDVMLDPSGDATIRSSPAPGGEVFTVQLGHDRFADRLRLYRTFWYQAVLSQPDNAFTFIDLRFDSQVITR